MVSPRPITSSVDGDSESSMFEDTMDSIIDGPPIEMNVGHELRIRPSRLVEPRSGSQAHPSSLIAEALEGGMDRIETSDRSDTIRRQVHACAERIHHSYRRIPGARPLDYSLSQPTSERRYGYTVA